MLKKVVVVVVHFSTTAVVGGGAQSSRKREYDQCLPFVKTSNWHSIGIWEEGLQTGNMEVVADYCSRFLEESSR